MSDVEWRYASWVPLAWVRALRSHPNELAVLITIASFADDAGQAFPTIETIAEGCGMREDRVTAAITALVKRGMLTRKMRPRQSSLYTVQGYRSSVPMTEKKGTDERGFRVPLSGDLGYRSAAAVSTTLSTQEASDDGDDPEKKLSRELSQRGIARGVARRAAAASPECCAAWLAIDWSRDLPAARNPVAVVTSALKNGIPPPPNFASRSDAAAIYGRFTPEIEDDLQRRLRAAEREAGES